MLAARLLSPSASPEFVGERREVFPIQRHDEINISRESSDIDEAKKSSRTDDRNIGLELFGNPCSWARSSNWAGLSTVGYNDNSF
jgi:hypothetical protein